MAKSKYIPEEVIWFSETTFKAYKKENRGYWDSKREAKLDYYASLFEKLPAVIDWVLRSGHQQQEKVQEVKGGIYAKIAGDKGPAFVAYLTKQIKKYGRHDIENIEFFPIILHEIITDIIKYNAEHPDDKLENPDELFNLSDLILKKRMKKAKEKGIDEKLAFDLFGIMPVPEAIEYSPFFRARGVFDIIYQYAASIPTLNFEKIINLLFNDNDYSVIIGYALQERKDKTKSFNESQKKIFNDINEWVFEHLEEQSKDEIRDILENYIKVRKRDAAQGKDGARRYFISSLPDTLYPKISRVVREIKNSDEEAEKYL